VSSYQGRPDWNAAKNCGIAGGIAKAGEYQEDPTFAYNVGQLRALKLWWAPYWFVRNTGCSHEGAQIVSVVRSVGGLTSGPVVLDMEVPESYGYAGCLDQAVYAAFGRHALIYTAPGTWAGGSNAGLALWQAEYGPTLHALWHPTLAWQFTDGQYGRVVYIPGIGTGDVSYDYGITKLTAAPQLPKVAPRLRARWHRAELASQRVYAQRNCSVLAQRVTWFPRTKHATRSRALRASQTVYTQRGCAVLAQRAAWYSQRLASTR
jgi:hypothetical protein